MNKTILVGPSKSLLTSKLGKIIDSYDVVCRMNSGGRPELLNDEYKEIIGSKKDIWLCKHIGLFNIYKNNGYKETVGFPQNGNLNKKYFNILNVFNSFKHRLTCGMLSIMYLIERYGKIDICGMDGFKGGHWYGNKFINNQDESDRLAAKGKGAHNILKEREYINYLVKQNKIKIIDE
jgi:hypothetical protein